MVEQRKFERVAELAASLQRTRDGRTVVHCHGVFDLLHIGHIRYLQAAKRLGDILVVTVTPDRHVNKGPHRPVFTESLRVDAVAALECVDFAAVNEWPTAVEAIGLLRPDIYCKGAEYRDRKTPELLREEQAVAGHGGRVEFIAEFTSSSSTLINSHLSPFTADTQQYLERLRGGDLLEQLSRLLERGRGLRTLVVGEAVLDEYHYCTVLGRAMKSPTLTVKYESQQRFAGGALAVANHLAAFCDQVGLFTMLGDTEAEEDWVRSHMRPQVDVSIHHKRDAPTIIRRQYHESYYQAPLFAVDVFDDRPLGDDESRQVCRRLESLLSAVDLVVVCDYGHQFLTADMARLLGERAPRLAVTTQADPSNFGLHTISRYPRADYACLSQQDLQLDQRSRTADVRSMLTEVARRLGTRLATVTMGQGGCLCYDGRAFSHGAGLATRIVDRSGGGEAFYAASALAMGAEGSPELVAFCGNLAGAEAVTVVGSAPTLDATVFRRHAESLLK